jgi:hypothetical protein
MSTRDELVDLVEDAVEDACYNSDGPPSLAGVVARYAADAILAAGYSKPRTTTTAEELDALPAESVLGATDGTVYRRAVDGLGAVWRAAGSGRNRFPDSIQLPATVLYSPEASK